MEEQKSKKPAFKSIIEATEKITIAGSSTIPSQVRNEIHSVATTHKSRARSIFGIRFKNLGVNRNPFLSKRAVAVLNGITYFCWTLTFIFLIGASINFQLLENIVISATSHDARIEETSPPIKLRNLD